MKVKVFDESHESDLEKSINNFLTDEVEVIDIKFSVGVSIFSEEQVYCFSALILYKTKYINN
ncbi:MAG: sporulation protein Cse60 [bacterium]|nr:sporulation protein Cse60 [bacterium]